MAGRAADHGHGCGLARVRARLDAAGALRPRHDSRPCSWPINCGPGARPCRRSWPQPARGSPGLFPDPDLPDPGPGSDLRAGRRRPPRAPASRRVAAIILPVRADFVVPGGRLNASPFAPPSQPLRVGTLTPPLARRGQSVAPPACRAAPRPHPLSSPSPSPEGDCGRNLILAFYNLGVFQHGDVAAGPGPPSGPAARLARACRQRGAFL